MIPVSCDPGVRGLVALGLAQGLGAGGADEGRAGLAAEIEAALSEIRTRHAGATAGQIAHLAAARDLYRALGIDPTRHRPSPEALTRRVLRGEDFPRVHPLVDLGNLWALRHGLPVGLYDLARVVPPVVARVGGPGEAYEGIRKGEVHLEGRLCLADARGPFGNPTSDSARTAIDEGSRDVLYVLFAPAAHDRSEMRRWLDWLAERLARWFGAEVTTALP